MMPRPLPSPAFPYTTLFRSRREPIRKPVESAIVMPAGWRIGQADNMEISPDGQSVAFVLRELRGGRTSLWIRPLASASFHHLPDRKSTRLNSSHGYTSYAVF